MRTERNANLTSLMYVIDQVLILCIYIRYFEIADVTINVVTVTSSERENSYTTKQYRIQELVVI